MGEDLVRRNVGRPRISYDEGSPEAEALAKSDRLDLKQVKPRHRDIMRRLVCGETARKIAKDMGINEQRMYLIVNSPLFKIELRKMEATIQKKVIDKVGDVTARLAKLQGPAVDVLEEIVKDEKKKIAPNTKRLAAMDILELSGARKDKNDDGMSDFAQFISETYAIAKQRHLEKLNKEIEDATDPSMLVDGASGGPLSIDDADDEALINASADSSLDVNMDLDLDLDNYNIQECEGSEDSKDFLSSSSSSPSSSSSSSSAVPLPLSPSLPAVPAASKRTVCDSEKEVYVSPISSLISSVINTGVVNEEDVIENKVEKGKLPRGPQTVLLDESEGSEKVEYLKTSADVSINAQEYEKIRTNSIIEAILKEKGLSAGLESIKKVLEDVK